MYTFAWLGYSAVTGSFACAAQDLRSGKLVHRFEGHNSNCYALDVDFERNLAVSAANDYRFIEWDLRQGRVRRCISLAMKSPLSHNLWQEPRQRTSVTHESPGHNINCGSSEITSLHESHFLRKKLGLSLDAKSRSLATGADDGLVKIWDLDSGWRSSVDCMHNQTVALDVDWSKRRLATASWDHNVDLWDLETGEHLHHFFKPRRCMTKVRLKK